MTQFCHRCQKDDCQSECLNLNVDKLDALDWPEKSANFEDCILNNIKFRVKGNTEHINKDDVYQAVSYVVKNKLIHDATICQTRMRAKKLKRVGYLSLEYLMGRSLQNFAINVELEDKIKEALMDLGIESEDIYIAECDAGLGNGGLGRLAACFLDSFATLKIPCIGYGLRYRYGIFNQTIVNGWQSEKPDMWLVHDNPWQIERHDRQYAVSFGGKVVDTLCVNGQQKTQWEPEYTVFARAFDFLQPGFRNDYCVVMRLWSAVPEEEFDFHAFDSGKYDIAHHHAIRASEITAVLYPNDETYEGKALRLKQQYFLCCATIQDILKDFNEAGLSDLHQLPDFIALQLNDTHPTIGIAELMRVLVDLNNIDWMDAMGICSRIFAYTNHTVLPEALEKWDVNLLRNYLPRHIEIIERINTDFLQMIQSSCGCDNELMKSLSIIEDSYGQVVNMAKMAVICCHHVNGVAKLHSELVKTQLFLRFVEIFKKLNLPDKFINITNGITQRRWLLSANPLLAERITMAVGNIDWVKNLNCIQALEKFAYDPNFVKIWTSVRYLNKLRFCNWVKAHHNIEITPDALFDVQIKRIHEYKRQTLNLFYNIYYYLQLKKLSKEERQKLVPRYVIIGGKAAPGYHNAKVIIKLINAFAKLVENDPEISPYFRMIYLPNYNVTAAEHLIPASDVNQQISTAGMEASGTSNMKFVLNGSLIVGTMDGATIEILEKCGPECAFIFGANVDQVAEIREKIRQGVYPFNEKFDQVIKFITSNQLNIESEDEFNQINNYMNQFYASGNGCCGDYYIIGGDFDSYVAVQQEVLKAYANQTEWIARCIKSVSRMGYFSSDRSIMEYSNLIWNVKPDNE